MLRPPDPEMRRGAAGNDTPKKSQSKIEPHQFSETASDYQAQTELAQIFARKFIVVRKRRRAGSAER